MPPEAAPGFNPDLDNLRKEAEKVDAKGFSIDNETDNPIYEALLEAGFDVSTENKIPLRYGTPVYDRIMDTCFKYMQIVIASESGGHQFADYKVMSSDRLRRDYHESLGKTLLGVDRYDDLSYEQRKQLKIFAAAASGYPKWVRIFRNESD